MMTESTAVADAGGGGGGPSRHAAHPRTPKSAARNKRRSVRMSTGKMNMNVNSSSSSRRFGTDLLNNSATEKKNGAVSKDVITSILKSGTNRSAPTEEAVQAVGTAPVPSDAVDAAALRARRNLELEGSLQRAVAAQQQQQQSSAGATSDTTATATPAPTPGAAAVSSTPGAAASSSSSAGITTTGTSKKVRVRVKKTPTSSARTTVASSRSATHHHHEYTVHFSPGPLGLKLEPITTALPPSSTSSSTVNGTTGANDGMGCRVVKFVTNSPRGTSSQAQQLGMITPGDVIVNIDGSDVKTWRYGEIIRLLKSRAVEGGEGGRGRVITFRSVSRVGRGGSGGRSAAASSASKLTSSSSSSGDGGTTTPKVRLFDSAAKSSSSTRTNTASDDNTTNDVDEDGNVLSTVDLNPISPAGLFSPSNIKKLQKEKKKQKQGKQTPEFTSRDVLLCGNSSILQTGGGGGGAAAAGGGGEGAAGGEGASTTNMQSYRPRVSGLLSNVVHQTLLPAVSTVYTNLSTSASVADAAAGKIGEALVGHSEQEFQEAVRAKMALLNELSEVRATLGADDAERRQLRSNMESLRRERDEAVKARGIFEEALQTTQKEEDRLRAAMEFTTEELNMVRTASLEAKSNANKLAAQNELLRAQAEQLRGHFGSKERAMVEQLAASQSQLEERVQSINTLQEEIGRYEDMLKQRDGEVASVSLELSDARASVQGLEEQLRDREVALASANKSVEDLRQQIATLEQSLADTTRSMDEGVAETESRYKAEIGQLQNEIDRVQSEAKAKLSQLETDLEGAASAKALLEEDVARITQELQQSREEVELCRTKIEEQMDEIDGLKANITGGVEEMQRQADEAAAAWQQKEAELKAELKEQRALAAQADAEFKERAAAFESELQEAASTKSSLEDDVKRLTDDFAESQDSLVDCQKQIERHASEIADVQSKMSKQIEELNRQSEESAKAWNSKESELTKEITRQQELVEQAEALSEAKEEYYSKAMRKLQTRFDAKKEIVNKLNQKHAESTAKFEANIAELKEEIDQKQSELAKAESERDGGSVEMQAELTAMMQAKDDMEKEMEALSAKCQSLQQTSAEMDEKFERLRSERDMLEIEKQSLAGKIALEAETYSKAKEEHKAELKKAREETNQIRKSFEDKVDAMISEVERVEKYMSSEHSKLESQNEELSLRLATRDDEIATLRERLVSTERSSTEEEGNHNAQILRLNNELDSIRHDLEQAEAKVQDSESRAIESLSKVQDREQAICVALLRQAKDKEDYDATLSQRDARIADIQSELSSAQAQVESIEMDKQQASHTAESNISHLVEIAEEADMRANHTKTLLDSRDKVLQSVKNSLTDACEQLDLHSDNGSLIASVTLISERASEAIQQSKDSQQDVAKVEGQLFQLRDALNTAAESLNQCETSREEWKAKAESAEEQAASLQAQIDALQTDVTVSNEANEALSLNLDELRSSLDLVTASRDRLNNAVSNEAKEKRELATKVGFLEQKLSRKVEECKRLEKIVEDFKAKCADIESKDREIESKTTDLNELQAKVVTLEGNVKDLQATNERSDFARQVAETRLSKTQENVSRIETEKTELELRLAAKSNELEEASAKVHAQESALKAAIEESKRLESANAAGTSDLDCIKSLLDGDGEGDCSVDKSALSATALHLYERIEELKQQQQQLQSPKTESETDTVLSTPICDKTKKMTKVPTPSQLLSPLLSPSLTTGIISKHEEMLADLKKMKEDINIAMTSPPSGVASSNKINIGEEASELEPRNDVLFAMEQRIQSLVSDLTSAKAALDEKESLIESVAEAVDEIEKEREETQHKVDTMQAYTERMEQTLTRELKWRQAAEVELRDLRRKANSTSTEQQKKVERMQRTVAQEVANQLQTTREKLFLLKSHLREGGSIVDYEEDGDDVDQGPRFSPISKPSDTSICWDLSEASEE